MTKVALISLGCAKNLINSEQMLYLLEEAGFELVPEADGADAVLVNTCGFIESAKTEAIDQILALGSLKEQGRLGKIIVAGCLSERYKEELLQEMPEVDAVLGVGSYGGIEGILRKTMDGERVADFGDNNAPEPETDRIVTTGPAWAYIKIAEGCDNRCSYCVIPRIRGRYRSRPTERILDEARRLADRGVKELIVVAQDITRYGTDLYGERRLYELLEGLSRIDGIEWIRLHYLYPDQIDDRLIDLIAKNKKILKYLDIPIQHISDPILKRMNRRGTGGDIRRLIPKLRERIPGVVLRTSLIAGLPGEGDREFEELCAFLREAEFERGGVFVFSPEEGTAAAEMDRPDEETARHRQELLFDLQNEIMERFHRERIGTCVRVLCEGTEDGFYIGRSYAESPDIDGGILFTGEHMKPGDFVTVRLTGTMNGVPIGEMA